MDHTPHLYTIGIHGLHPTRMVELVREADVEIALDIRPESRKASAKRIGEMLRWRAGVPDTAHAHSLGQWRHSRRAIDRLVATLIKKGNTLLICDCPEPWRCERRHLAARAYLHLDKNLDVTHLGFDGAPPKFSRKGKTTCDAKRAPGESPEQIDKKEARAAWLAGLRSDSDRMAALFDAVESMDKSLQYRVMTEKADTGRKRTVNGWFSGTAEAKGQRLVLLEDSNGRINKVPVDEIVVITIHPEEEHHTNALAA